MYRKTKIRIQCFTPHPHFKQDVGNGFRILNDAPEISKDLSPEMFSLRVNQLNGRNLQPVTLEESNRLASLASLESLTHVVESDIDKQLQDAESEKRYQQYLHDIEESKEEKKDEK